MCDVLCLILLDIKYLEFNLEGDIFVVKLNKYFMNVKKRVWDEREKRLRDL